MLFNASSAFALTNDQVSAIIGLLRAFNADETVVNQVYTSLTNAMATTTATTTVSVLQPTQPIIVINLPAPVQTTPQTSQTFGAVPVSAPEVVKDLKINAVATTTISLNGWDSFGVSGQYTENGQPTKTDWTFSGDEMPTATFSNVYSASNPSIVPKNLGIHTVTVTAGGITKSVIFNVIPYVKIDPVAIAQPVYQPNSSNGHVPTNSVVISRGYTGTTIANFSIVQGDEPFTIQKMYFATDAATNLHGYVFGGKDGAGEFTINSGSGFSQLAIPMTGNLTSYPIRIQIDIPSDMTTGNYTFSITGINAMGINSGNIRTVQGLPITFHFTVQ